VTPAEITAFYRTLGRSVKKAREKSKLTQAKLGEAIGLSRTSVTNLEKGRQHIPAHLLFAIGDAVGRDAGTLLPGADEMRATNEFELPPDINDPDIARWLTSVMRHMGNRS
jgi:transcriptional regulator with XRE-family HTH domain